MNLLLDRSEIVSFENEYGIINSAVNIIYPQPNQEVQYDEVFIQWNSVPGANEYHVQISPLPLFSNLVFNGFVSDTFLVLPPFLKDRTHFLRIKPSSPISLCENFGERVPFLTTQLTGINIIGEYSFNIDFQNVISTQQPIELLFSGDAPKELKLKLVNLKGQMVFQDYGRFFPGQNYKMSSQNLPSGMYFLNVELNNGEQFTRKLIIQ